MRYSLLASASLIAIAFAGSASLPAMAAECGCGPAVAAVLAKEHPVVAAKKAKPAPHRVARAKPAAKPAMQPASACLPCAAASADQAESYDYASSLPVDSYPYTHHWEVAPQGYVPPPPAPMAAMTPQYDGPADQPTYDGDADASSYGQAYASAEEQSAGAATAYMGGVDGFAGFAPAAAPAVPVASNSPYITIDTRGFYGGAGRAASGVGFGGGEGGGGGGGGGGGETLTLSRPDSYNGPSYNSFNESYGGDYQSANRLSQYRQRALNPPAPASGSGGH